MAEEYWGKNVMTQAVTMLCDKIFKETDIIRIFAEPFAYNMGSRRVLEKAGFQFEGILHDNAVKNGKVIDMALYALVKKPDKISFRNYFIDVFGWAQNARVRRDRKK